MAPTPDHVRVPPWGLALIWAVVAVFYVLCGSMVALQGLAYLYIHKNAQTVLFGVELLGVNVQRGMFPYMSAASLAIACIHYYNFIRMMYRTITSRSLQFANKFSSSASTGTTTKRRTISKMGTLFPERMPYMWRLLKTPLSLLYLLYKSFDVTNPNYGVVYFIKEFIQTTIQTLQAYRLGARMTRSWMNDAIVLLLVVNCWALPLIRHVLRVKSIAKARLLCVLINLVLDFVSCYAIPMALLAPYVRDFNRETGTFDEHFWYKDTWLFQLPNVWPLLFWTSIWDGLSRLFIAFGMTRTLRSVAKLLHQPVMTGGAIVAVKAVAKLAAQAHQESTAVKAPDDTLKKKLSRQVSRLPRPSTLRMLAERWGHILLGLWGFIILALHIQSSSTKQNKQCLTQVRPWLVRRPVCSVMEINCQDGQLTGNATDFNATIDSIDDKWLSYLVIRHCPAVEITPRVRDLTWLHALKIFNSTLVSWGDDAALTQTDHPNVLIVFLVASNMSAFPTALYNADFPAMLMDIEVSYVNLTEIPSQLAEVWHPGMFLVMEGLQLPAFPDVLAALQPSYYSLAFNGFTEIPDSVFANPILAVLNLNGNPIPTIPTGEFTILSLTIVQTEVTLVPTWLPIDVLGAELAAGSSPLCTALQQNDATVLGLKTATDLPTWQSHVNCTPASEYTYLTRYPLVNEATNNPSRVS